MKMCHRYKHGMVGTKVYNAWSAMVQRCTNKNHPFYKDYGGREVTVCDEWISDFMAFYKYIGDPPFESASIDRIDNAGNYEPGNLRWATKSDQVRNQRKRKGTSSIYKHVYWCSTFSRWKALSPRPNRVPLGTFKTELEASHAVDKFIRRIK